MDTVPTECPVIHKVTDHDTSKQLNIDSLPDPKNNNNPSSASLKEISKCPIDHTKKSGQLNNNESKTEVTDDQGKKEEKEEKEVEGVFDDDQLYPDETPSQRELRQIKKVMHMITMFYKKGSDTKLERANAIETELNKVMFDKQMAKKQLEALTSNPKFAIHPKAKGYIHNLEDELKGLEEFEDRLSKQKKEAFDLYKWSGTIVEVCLWLEANLEEYISKVEQQDNFEMKPPPLSVDQAKIYAKGLDEIVYNLKESQDFFSASVDGRLNKYHQIECEIIESQLQVLSEFPADNQRRQFVEEELLKDLTFTKSNMKEDPKTLQRRTTMLENHKAFFNVLKFHKEKLGLLTLEPNFEREYDPKYDHYQ